MSSKNQPEFGYDEGQTPIDYDERQGLLPSWLTTRNELNEAEQDNIARGALWAYGAIRRPKTNVLDELFVRELHRRMFGDVWRWAGKFRDTEKNIGIAPYNIAPALRNLLDDVPAWMAHKTYNADEILARFHHRLVFIHLFPNGNGRHARLITDLLAVRSGVNVFTWGSLVSLETVELRKRYIEALREADRGNVDSLVASCRS